ncbi:hypothetical protein Henu3_gp19 [Mycobacterium phage Henu3 PeY-2017]|nr:hypothetical protein Henu3_gp19 [Mycobacterium phage Henu3 PeY-2017]
MSLPDAVRREPTCGSCGEETYFDGDSFICDHCLIFFHADDLSASFLDVGADTCGEPCQNFWHGSDRIKPGMSFECGTCQLPAGHLSGHWTDCHLIDGAAS